MILRTSFQFFAIILRSISILLSSVPLTGPHPAPPPARLISNPVKSPVSRLQKLQTSRSKPINF